MAVFLCQRGGSGGDRRDLDRSGANITGVNINAY